jgi:hypothetical protein
LKLIFATFFIASTYGDSLPNIDNKKCILTNGIEIVLQEDFRTPMVLIGLIYHTGTHDAPLRKQGIPAIIAANFISEKTHKELLNLGIFYEVNVKGRYTEILARMNPKDIKKFFQIICRNDFSLINWEVLKKQIIIDQRLAHVCFEDAVENKISAHIKYNGININNVFNKKIMSSISCADIKEYYIQHYEKCHLSLLVNGAITYKDLVKILQSTLETLPSRPQAAVGSMCSNQFFKEIYIQSKHIGRSIRYFYKISAADLTLAEAFFRVFYYKLFDFFEKANQLIFDYTIFNVISNGDKIWQVVLYPKSDVSLADLQIAYNVFTDSLCRQKIPPKKFSMIQMWSNFADQFLRSDMDEVYEKMKNDYFNEGCTKTEISNSTIFNALGEKFLKSSLILKIITSYKPDK